MRTPSLRSRVVVLGIIVVVVVVSCINAFLYVAFRTALSRDLNDVLRQRATLVRAEANGQSAAELADRLSELGLQAAVRGPDGAIYEAEPPSPSIGKSLAGHVVMHPDRSAAREVSVPGDFIVTVFANRTGVDDAERNLLLFDGVGLVLAALLAGLLLHRTSDLALRPVAEIAASARRTSAGHHGERLRPDRPDTPLGQLASAYDDMLDSLAASAKQSTDAQLESELHYLHLRQVIETANAAFVGMDSSGAITDWNRKAEEIFGWTEREVIGQQLAETIVPSSLRAAHRAGLRRFLDTGEHRVLGKSVEFEALHRDGHLIPIEVATWVTYIGDQVTFSALLHDLTERRKGEEAIGRLASIVESAQEAIVSTSLDGSILTWNLGAERTYGFTAQEAVGTPVSLIVPPDRTDEITDVQERAQRGEGVSRYETVRRRKDGTEVEVAVTGNPIFDAWGNVTGASDIARDITAQRRMALALEDSLAAVEGALAATRRSDERSRQFLADAAHQLSGPIAAVRACAETLLLANRECDRDALLANLVRDTARAGRLVRALLRLARLDQGPPPELEQCDIEGLCESEVQRTRVLAPEIDIALHVSEIPADKMLVDPASLTEILSNLLDNARRHAVASIHVSIRVDDGRLHIVVADDGPGTPGDAVGKVFERFVSLDGQGGSGLGLPIARGLARGCGGDLTYGARGFLLTLPFRTRVGEDIGARTSPQAETRATENQAKLKQKMAEVAARLELEVAGATAVLEATQAETAAGPRRMLTAKGEPLKEAVTLALGQLGYLVKDCDLDGPPDPDGGIEDLGVTDPDAAAFDPIIEVTGYHGDTDAGDIGQTIRHLGRAIAGGRSPSAIWWVADHWRRRAADDRPLLPAGEDAIISEYANDPVPLVVIDTKDLFRAARAVEDGAADAAAVRALLRAARGRWGGV